MATKHEWLSAIPTMVSFVFKVGLFENYRCAALMVAQSLRFPYYIGEWYLHYCMSLVDFSTTTDAKHLGDVIIKVETKTPHQKTK